MSLLAAAPTVGSTAPDFTVKDTEGRELTLSALVVFLSVFVIAMFEPYPALDVVFEAVSAFGTVGLSRGITPSLTSMSKLVIVLTMLIGRVGAVTMLLALTRKAVAVKYEYPSENVII